MDNVCWVAASQYVSYLNHEAGSEEAKDGCGQLQPEQDRQVRGEQNTEVHVLTALGDDGDTALGDDGNAIEVP